MSPKIFSCLAALLLATAAAEARPVQTTTYKYYPIKGTNVSQVYASMIKRGPDVHGDSAYAATAATSSQSGKLVQGKTCRIEDYRFKIDFVVKLPRLSNEKALNSETLANWRRFQQFLKAHEDHHRQIWLGCAAGLEAKVKTMTAPDCQTLDRRATKLWKDMQASCTRQHQAFDAAEQRRVLRHPFVRQVIRQMSKHNNALTISVD